MRISAAHAAGLLVDLPQVADIRPLNASNQGATFMGTVADQFAAILAAAGVKRIYGIVGDSLNGLTDAIRRQGKIEWIHVRHEEVGAFAAGGAGQPTRPPALRCGRGGP